MEALARRPESLQSTQMIVNHWSKEFRSQYGDMFPVDYTCFDTETSGFNRKTDIIVEWGHCIVRDCKVTDKLNVIINWYGSGLVPDEWIDQALLRVARHVKINTGHTFKITPKLMKKKGVPVDEIIPFMWDFLKIIIDQGEFLVSHNGWNYDVHMLEAHFRDFYEKELVIPPNQMIDTGAIEKASQVPENPLAHPKKGETMKEYFSRVAYFKAAGIKWSLDDHCVDKYNLTDKYDIDRSKAHQAGHDAWLLHLLMEEYRQLIEEEPSEPTQPKVQSALRKRDPNVTKTKKVTSKKTDRGLATSDKKRRRGQRNR